MKFKLPNFPIGKKEKLERAESMRVLTNLYISKPKSSAPNNHVNSNLRRIELRLKRLAKENPKNFWALASLLLKKSKSLRMLALRNVKPNWYKDTSLNKIVRTMRKLNGICRRPRATMEIKRTGIPKEDGTTRFINAPSLENRLYLWMCNYFLAIFLEGRLSEHQHGHRHGRGVSTAWKEILTNWDKYMCVMEFDFKGFHDEIRRHFLVKSLTNLGVSEEWTIKIGNLCSSYVRNTDPEDPMRRWVARDEWQYHHFWKGVVQGMNLAGLCGLAVLEELGVYDMKDGKYIGYADDGVLMTNNPQALDELRGKLRTKESGVQLKEAKCGYVKMFGVLEKPLKFTGVSFDGEFLSAKTRSGKSWRTKWEGENTLLPPNDVIRDYEKRTGIKKPMSKIWRLDNNLEYLGNLFALLWSNDPYDRKTVNPDLTLKEAEYLLKIHNQVGSRSWLGKYRDKIELAWNIEMNLQNASTVAYHWMSGLLELPEFSQRRKLRSKKGSRRNWALSDSIGGQVTPDGKGMTVTTKSGGYLIASAYPRPCPEIMPADKTATKWNRHFDNEVATYDMNYDGFYKDLFKDVKDTWNQFKTGNL